MKRDNGCTGEIVRPLDGVKVLDLSIFIAGSACGTMLGYMGADVIKVEPLKGDPYRNTGKGYSMPSEKKKNPLYDHCNGYKRCIALDFRSDEGRETLRRLAAASDIVVTNYRENALAGMKMTYADIKEYNPTVVYAAFNGYGENGPDSKRPGFDGTAFFARSGFSMRGTYKGAPPMVAIPGGGDNISGMALTLGVMSAYAKRLRTGEGEEVNCSLLGSAMYCMSTPVVQAQYGHLGVNPREAPGFSAMMNDYLCKDGVWIRVCAVGVDTYWKAFCRALGMEEEYGSDPRFCTGLAHLKNVAGACAVSQEYFAKWDSAEIYARLMAEDVPVEYDYYVADTLKDEQVLINHFVNPVTYDDGEQVYLAMPPFKLRCVDDTARGRGPGLGEHTKEVLAECGFSEEEIAKMLEGGKVSQI